MIGALGSHIETVSLNSDRQKPKKERKNPMCELVKYLQTQVYYVFFKKKKNYYVTFALSMNPKFRMQKEKVRCSKWTVKLMQIWDLHAQAGMPTWKRIGQESYLDAGVCLSHRRYIALAGFGCLAGWCWGSRKGGKGCWALGVL